MLVLSRRCGERVIIGDNVITITLLETKGYQTRIGIVAPENVSIHREEVYDRIQAKKSSQIAKEQNSKEREGNG